MSYEKALLNLPSQVDIVLMDPPYKDIDFYQKGVSLLLEKNVLKEDSVIVLEYENEISIDETPFREVRNYRYGRNKIKILWR